MKVLIDPTKEILKKYKKAKKIKVKHEKKERLELATLKLKHSCSIRQVTQYKLLQRTFKMFQKYGTHFQEFTLDELIDFSNHHAVIARVENSGSEGIYVEVAVHDEKNDEWRRLCFRKCWTEEEAEELQKKIPTEPYSLIHNMKNFIYQ